MHIEALFLLNGNITCFYKAHEVSAPRQHGDNLARRDFASPFRSADIKISVLEGGTSIGKEIGKRGPIDLGGIPSKSEADDEGEILDRGKIL